MKKYLIVILFVLSWASLIAQNTAITDDDGYTADPSAMLDVKSISKGMLIPRMTSVQRNTISAPATGLLVFDTNENGFYYYNGTSWTQLSSGQIWSTSAGNVYLSNSAKNVGIGTLNPSGKMEVKGDASIGLNEPLFCVVNENSDTVFAVYNEGVRIWVNDDGSKASGSRGGFAVGGYSPSKGTITNEYLRVTPDSVRIYIDDSYIAAKSSGSRGGFAVGGFDPSKGTATDNYLFVQDDSTRVFVNDSTSGFEVANIEAGTGQRLMKLTSENYFIGHQAGDSITTGIYNTFFGYNAGFSDKMGSENIFIGRKAGYLNTDGSQNVFLGNRSGFNNRTGSNNVCLGNYAGMGLISGTSNVMIGNLSGVANSTGTANVFIGENSGNANDSGNENIFLGIASGFLNTSGSQNVFIGSNAGRANLLGSHNIFIGYRAGYNNQGTAGGLGSYNTFLGYQSGYLNQLGESNTFMGYQSGFSNVNGVHNTYLGRWAGQNNEGNYNVFIGTEAGRYNTNSSYRLHIEAVNGTIYSAPLIYGEFDNRRVVIDGDQTDIPGGFPNLKLIVAGNAYANNWFTPSDRNLKTNVQKISDPLGKVMKMQGVFYEWKDKEKYNSGNQLGFIAQELYEVLPEVVNQGSIYSINYAPITALLVEAVKQQQNMIEELKKENESLKAEVQNIKILQNQIDKINESLNINAKK